MPQWQSQLTCVHNTGMILLKSKSNWIDENPIDKQSLLLSPSLSPSPLPGKSKHSFHYSGE